MPQAKAQQSNNYDIIPYWVSPNGDERNYWIIYVNNEKGKLILCTGVVDPRRTSTSSPNVSGECQPGRASVNTVLPGSGSIKTVLGAGENFIGSSNGAVGLWRVDQKTGRLEFCGWDLGNVLKCVEIQVPAN
jgi:hypothetical protein